MRANLMQGDALRIPLADGVVQCVVTSPPYYGLRDYSADGQLGLESTLAEYIENMVAVFAEVWRVLADTGVVFLNMGDSYNGSGAKDTQVNSPKQMTNRGGTSQRGTNETWLKPKDLMMVPHRLAIALQEWGWWVRSDIVWHKPNPMPESVTDRPTKSHEYIFLLSKNARYYYDQDAVREVANYDGRHDEIMKGSEKYANGFVPNQSPQSIALRGHERWKHRLPDGTRARNRRSVWTITTKPYSGAHFATFPPEIPEVCIKAGTSEKGQCPECGAPWVRVVEKELTGELLVDGSIKKTKASRRYEANGSEYNSDTSVFKTGMWNKSTTTGWQPTCSHDLEPVPQIVLDPFNGSGTTVAVAQALGRIGVGQDISWEYLQLARERTGLSALDEWQNGRKAEANLEGLPMWSE